MNVVVLGTGNMGSIFAARLIKAGHRVSVIARNQRLRELQENGLRLRHQYTGKIEHYAPEVHPGLTPEIEADLILVTVQRPHIDALMPALTAHPCPMICFMFNCSKIEPAWQEALGKRLVWGFPSALAGTREGIVNYLVLPGWLRFLQITTVGEAKGGDSVVAQSIVKVLNQAGIASTYHPDMESWLMTHTALMLPPMLIGRRKYESRANQALSWREARQIIQAQKECFRVVEASGGRVTPINMRLLKIVPALLGTLGIWMISKTPAYGRAVTDHVDHGQVEMLTMYDGIKSRADSSGVAVPVLDALMQEILRLWGPS